LRQSLFDKKLQTQTVTRGKFFKKTLLFEKTGHKMLVKLIDTSPSELSASFFLLFPPNLIFNVGTFPFLPLAGSFPFPFFDDVFVELSTTLVFVDFRFLRSSLSSSSSSSKSKIYFQFHKIIFFGD